MSGKRIKIDVSNFISHLLSWNDSENVGAIIRSLAESMDKWTGSSKLKKLRKFVVTYCPEVMDNLEIMTGITENWRFQDIVYMLKKRKVEGNEFTQILTKYVCNELVDICSEESMKEINSMKNKFSMESLRDIIILAMMQKNVRFGWSFLDNISRSWTTDKLETLVKMICENESFVDISNGKDGGLFEIFPYMEDKVTIHAVLDDNEESDSEGSLVDFIEDDIGEREKKRREKGDQSELSDCDSEVSFSSDDDDDDEDEDEDDDREEEEEEYDSNEMEEEEERGRKRGKIIDLIEKKKDRKHEREKIKVIDLSDEDEDEDVNNNSSDDSETISISRKRKAELTTTRKKRKRVVLSSSSE